jgi:hypothetical protein
MNFLEEIKLMNFLEEIKLTAEGLYRACHLKMRILYLFMMCD